MNLLKKTFCLLLFLIVSFGFSYGAYVDTGNKKNSKEIDILKLNYELKRGATRSVVIGSGSNTINKESWGKFQIKYASMKEEWLDEVKVKFYALFFKQKGKEVKDNYTLLSTEISYINVPKGKDNLAECFIHPASLKRHGELKELRAEIWIGGEMKEFMTESYSAKSEKNFLYANEWWKFFTAKTNELLNVFLTPFVHDGDNSQEMIKVS